MTRARARALNPNRLRNPNTMREAARALMGSPLQEDFERAKLLNEMAKRAEAKLIYGDQSQ